MKVFDEQDLAMHRGLVKILEGGTFPLKVEDIDAFIKIIKWVKELPNKEAPKPNGLSK